MKFLLSFQPCCYICLTSMAQVFEQCILLAGFIKHSHRGSCCCANTLCLVTESLLDFIVLLWCLSLILVSCLVEIDTLATHPGQHEHCGPTQQQKDMEHLG